MVICDLEFLFSPRDDDLVCLAWKVLERVSGDSERLVRARRLLSLTFKFFPELFLSSLNNNGILLSGRL